MAENKTQPTKKDAVKYINSIKDIQLKEDCLKLASIMEKATGEKPVMWGASVVGFGKVHYIYKSGRQGDWMKTAFAVRSGKISVYIFPDIDNYPVELGKLGKHSRGRACLYIRRLADIDIKTLTFMITDSVKKFKSGVYKAPGAE
ncbi:MAG: DUF1801 domain-containing protein [Candidatus Goldbacteria bacterium]|nr:DUF1801 domain-containing protein [Candidatus Goldiibacteriota bacterium]